jgi:hypothetical protein
MRVSRLQRRDDGGVEVQEAMVRDIAAASSDKKN